MPFSFGTKGTDFSHSLYINMFRFWIFKEKENVIFGSEFEEVMTGYAEHGGFRAGLCDIFEADAKHISNMARENFVKYV